VPREAVDLQPTEVLAVPEAVTAGLAAGLKSPYVEIELATLPTQGRTTVTSRVRTRKRGRVGRDYPAGGAAVLHRSLSTCCPIFPTSFLWLLRWRSATGRSTSGAI
jgi:hypothetical protein